MDGVAAYAASQVFRMAPRDARMGLFTYSSIGRDSKQPLFKLSNAVRRSELASTVTGVLTNVPNNRHPYSFNQTPCNTALKAAANWLRTLPKPGDSKVAVKSTIFFLTDGVCSRGEDVPSTPGYLNGIELFVIDFSVKGLSRGLKEAAFKVEAVKSTNALRILNVLDTFGTVMDDFEGRSGNTRRTLKSQDLDQLAKDTAQAYRVHVFTTAPGAADSSALLNKLSDRVKSEQRFETGQWSWWQGQGTFPPNFQRNKHWTKGQSTQPFHWAYLELYPSELEGLKDIFSEKGRENIVRPEWIITFDQKRYLSSCQDRTASTDVMVGTESKREPALICPTVSAQVMKADKSVEPLSFRTLNVAYLGGGAAAGYPSDLEAKFVYKTVLHGKASGYKERTADMGPVAKNRPEWLASAKLPICHDKSMPPNEDYDIGDLSLTFQLVNNRLTPPRLAARIPSSQCFDADADGDKEFNQRYGGIDCNDQDADINTKQPEVCDGKDNDCDGDLDPNALAALNSAVLPPNAPYTCDGQICTCTSGERRGKSFKRYLLKADNIKGVDEGCANSDDDGFANHRGGEYSTNDADNDGCLDASDETKFDFCNPTLKADCRNQCTWGLTGGGAKAKDGAVVFDAGDLTQSPNGSQTVSRDVDTNVLEFKCPGAESLSEFTVKFEADSAGASCFSVASVAESYTVSQQGAVKPIELRVTRQAQCGKVHAPKEGEADPGKIEKHLDLIGRLIPQGAAAGKFSPLVLRVKASFKQSIELTHKGALVDLGDRDYVASAKDGSMVTMAISPTVGTWMKRYVRPVYAGANHLNVDDLSEKISPFLKPGEGDWTKEREARKQRGHVYGLLFSDCNTPSKVDADGKNETGGSIFVMDASERTRDVCLSLNPKELAICPGGGLFTFGCDSLDTSLADSAVKPAKIVLENVGHGDDSSLKVGGGLGKREHREVFVNVKIERGFLDWLKPGKASDGGGPGWWWIVLFAFIFIMWGTLSTQGNCYDGKKVARGPMLFYLSVLALGVCYVLFVVAEWSPL